MAPWERLFWSAITVAVEMCSCLDSSLPRQTQWLYSYVASPAQLLPTWRIWTGKKTLFLQDVMKMMTVNFVNVKIVFFKSFHDVFFFTISFNAISKSVTKCLGLQANHLNKTDFAERIAFFWIGTQVSGSHWYRTVSFCHGWSKCPLIRSRWGAARSRPSRSIN